ncbi:galactose mutarotase [Mitsuaria sp. GD03876]|uniref:aldose epimerase family protein n=1 Tax=Mitsuaria sp. GD03876 TaxID=2975399 RepID=UPI00244AFF2C|nr:galactose mutarotase [Mitsuaria sp. GD03876]MDH0865800.1 galactose mutarotase [Mitsuaria sp. GD03876]
MKPIQRRVYGHLPDGRPVHEYVMDNGRGLRLSAITLGGIVTRLEVPDARGEVANVVLGLPTLEDYLLRNPHFGVIVGRYGNRIAQAAFRLDGERHALVANDGTNCLHGGTRGFGWLLWRAEAESDDCLRFDLDSPDGDQGFPGRLRVAVRYRLVEDMGWQIEYEATTDRPTVVNLTHHDYFNLAGRGSALGHELQIAASRYCEVDGGLIPTSIATVADTPFDFREARVIESRLRQAHPQLQRGKGYDHNWVLDAPFDGRMHLAARLRDPVSGRAMEVLTTEPAMQFYSGNFLDGSLLGSGGEFHRQGDGVCLETQHNPDSPNRTVSADWPSTVLRPGETYRSATLHRFSSP